MYFAILTAALTLHAHNEQDIQSSRQVAEALKPLAGSFAAALYTISLIEIGPGHSNPCRFKCIRDCGNVRLERGLGRTCYNGALLYAIIGASTLLGVALVFAKISPIKALFWSSVINGLLAPFLLVGILIASSDPKLMQRQPSPWFSRLVVGLTAGVMFLAGAMFFL